MTVKASKHAIGLTLLDSELVCRTYRIRGEQDDVIAAIGRRTGNSMSSIVRDLLAKGIAETERIERLAKRRA